MYFFSLDFLLPGMPGAVGLDFVGEQVVIHHYCSLVWVDGARRLHPEHQRQELYRVQQHSSGFFFVELDWHFSTMLPLHEFRRVRMACAQWVGLLVYCVFIHALMFIPSPWFFF